MDNNCFGHLALCILSGSLLFVSCGEKEDVKIDAPAQSVSPSDLVGPAGAISQKAEKFVWDGSLIIDLDSIKRSSINDLKNWNAEWIAEIDDTPEITWKLPDGSMLFVLEDAERRCDSVALKYSKWNFKEESDVLKACGYTEDKWTITRISGPSKKEMTMATKTEVWMVNKYAVSSKECTYNLEIDKTPDGYYVERYFEKDNDE